MREQLTLSYTAAALRKAPQQAWLGVASAEHAAYGAERGWIQLNHGKRHNLARLARGDGFVYYSPTQEFGDRKPLRAITQLGFVTDDKPYLASEPMNMGGTCEIRPWRRNVDFLSVQPVAVHTLALELTKDKNWGHPLRFGLVPLSLQDFDILSSVMTAEKLY